MPIKIRSAVLALIPVAGIMVLAGCGGDGGPDPSISPEDTQTLLAEIQEIEDNVEVGSCIVASDRTDQLISDVGELPDSVAEDVRQALDNGANNLRLLLADPDQCEREETTVETTTEEEPTTTEEEETTTRETTTRPEQTQTRTTATQTQTTPTQTQTTPTNPSGGVGPGSSRGQ
jgi:hypothetical protein